MISDARLRGERLTVLRDLYGLTQQRLAEDLGVSQGFLSQVERGDRPLPAEVARMAAQRFTMAPAFFAAFEGPAGTGEFTFRKKSSALVRDERRIKALHREAARLFYEASAASGLAPANLPDPQQFADPEECAETLRARAGLTPNHPIRNMTRFVERLGVGVINGLDGGRDEVSEHTGISRPSPVNDRPLVAVVLDVPGAVQRMSVGHELGHLIYDRHLDAPIRSTRSPEETRAFRFAGALLLPAEVARARISESLTLHAYLRIKADYGISVPGILRRARDLGIISAARYRSLSIQVSSMGWRDNRAEPVEVPNERPTMLRQAIVKVGGREPAFYAAHRWGVRPTDVQRWLGTEESTEANTSASVTPLRPQTS